MGWSLTNQTNKLDNDINCTNATLIVCCKKKMVRNNNTKTIHAMYFGVGPARNCMLGVSREIRLHKMRTLGKY
jgi:hypothetical protein